MNQFLSALQSTSASFLQPCICREKVPVEMHIDCRIFLCRYWSLILGSNKDAVSAGHVRTQPASVFSCCWCKCRSGSLLHEFWEASYFNSPFACRKQKFSAPLPFLVNPWQSSDLYLRILEPRPTLSPFDLAVWISLEITNASEKRRKYHKHSLERDLLPPELNGIVNDSSSPSQFGSHTAKLEGEN